MRGSYLFIISSMFFFFAVPIKFYVYIIVFAAEFKKNSQQSVYITQASYLQQIK